MEATMHVCGRYLLVQAIVKLPSGMVGHKGRTFKIDSRVWEKVINYLRANQLKVRNSSDFKPGLLPADCKL